MSGNTKLLSINPLRNIDSALNFTTFAQDNFGFNLSSDFIPTGTSAFINAGLSLSESGFSLLVIYIFDFVVIIFLAIDFCIRLRASPQKLRYVINHWYEFPAMLSLALFGVEGEKQAKEEVQFLRSQNYCVCFIQMVNTTGGRTIINDSDNIRKYYTIFINTMSAIARNFAAKIVKNITDSLIVYFPQTSNSTDDSAFKDVIECGITMLADGDVINTKLTEQRLSVVIYRISADYGKVEVARSTTSQREDLFGPTMNLCAKINSKAPANGMIIGGDLYTVLKSFSYSYSSSSSYSHTEYRFKEVKGHSISGLTHQYPVYSVTSKYSRSYPDVANLSTLKDGKRTQKPEIKKQIQRPSFSASPISTTSSSYSGYTIMLVDDEQDVLYSFHAALTNNGYDVETFSDSQEALKRFSQVTRSLFGLVILDVRMPGLNGLELYYRLKSINRNIKILFVSALDVVPELVSIFPDTKQDDILRKPVTTEKFINTTKTALA